MLCAIVWVFPAAYLLLNKSKVTSSKNIETLHSYAFDRSQVACPFAKNVSLKVCSFIPKEVPSSSQLKLKFLWWNSWITFHPNLSAYCAGLRLEPSKGRQWNAKPAGPSLVCSDYHPKEQTERWSYWHASIYKVDDLLYKSYPMNFPKLLMHGNSFEFARFVLWKRPAKGSPCI